MFSVTGRVCVSTAVPTYVMDTYDGMRVSLSYCVNAIMMCAADSVYVSVEGGVLCSSVVVREMAICRPVGVGRGK